MRSARATRATLFIASWRLIVLPPTIRALLFVALCYAFCAASRRVAVSFRAVQLQFDARLGGLRRADTRHRARRATICTVAVEVLPLWEFGRFFAELVQACALGLMLADCSNFAKDLRNSPQSCPRRQTVGCRPGCTSGRCCTSA